MLAQDKGKTEAAKLASESRAALKTLPPRCRWRKQLANNGRSHSRLSRNHQSRPRNRRPVWRGHAVEERRGGGVLQDHGRVVRPPGRRPEVRLRDVLHERESRSLSSTTRTASKSGSARASWSWTRAWGRARRRRRSRTTSTRSSSDRRASWRASASRATRSEDHAEVAGRSAAPSRIDSATVFRTSSVAPEGPVAIRTRTSRILNKSDIWLFLPHGTRSAIHLPADWNHESTTPPAFSGCREDELDARPCRPAGVGRVPRRGRHLDARRSGALPRAPGCRPQADTPDQSLWSPVASAPGARR